jgi:hypothetical protein
MVTPDGFLTGLTGLSACRARTWDAKLESRQTRQVRVIMTGLTSFLVNRPRARANRPRPVRPVRRESALVVRS